MIFLGLRSRSPHEILEVGSGGEGGGTKFRGLDDILEVGKMSLDVWDSDIKQVPQKTSITDAATLLKSHFVINIFLEVP